MRCVATCNDFVYVIEYHKSILFLDFVSVEPKNPHPRLLEHPSLTAAMHTKDPLYAPTMYVYGQDTAPAMYSKKRKENR